MRYQYADFDIEENSVFKVNPPQDRMKLVQRIIGRTQNGTLLVAQQHIPLAEDHVMSYGNNLCMWGMQLMHMNDMAKEGDIGRTKLAVKLSTLFFSPTPA